MIPNVKPGFYKPDELSNSEYHGGNLVTKSKLDKLDRSPAHLKEYLDNPQDETKALRIGKALHCAVLEPELFDLEYVREFDPADHPDALQSKSELVAVVEQYNATLPPLASIDELKSIIQAYNDELPKPIKLNQKAEDMRAELSARTGEEIDPELDKKELKSIADDYNAEIGKDVLPIPRSRDELMAVIGGMENEKIQAWVAAEKEKPAPIDPNQTIPEITTALRNAGQEVQHLDSLRGGFYARNEGKCILSHQEYDQIVGMREAIRRHKGASQVLTGGMAECSIVTELNLVTDSGNHTLTAGIRPDYRISGDKNYIVDVKTTEDARIEHFSREIEKYRYDVQAAFYKDVHESAGLGKINAFIFVVVEKKPPYAVRCWYATPNMLKIGRKKYQANLETIAECIANDNWPAYPDTIDPISVPEWAERRAQDDGII